MNELDRLAHGDSPVHRWDARWKLTAGAGFVIATLLLRQQACATAALAAALLLTVLANLPLGPLLSRLKGPLLVIIVVAAMLALTGRGERIGPCVLSLSVGGAKLGLLMAAKSTAIVLMLVVVTSTSPAQRVLAAMEQLGVPHGLVQVLHLAYRYVFLIQSEGRAVQIAMRARGFRASVQPRKLAVLGNVVGMLLIRSTERAERVYLAMQARGFTGALPVCGGWQTRTSDILGLAVIVVVSCGLVIVDRLLAAG